MQRLAAGAVARERPGEHVVAEDARPKLVTLTCEHERMLQAHAVVDVEECDVEIVAHAVRREETLDVADQRVLALRRGFVPTCAVQVAEQADVLRQRDPVDRRALVADCRAQVAERDLCCAIPSRPNA